MKRSLNKIAGAIVEAVTLVWAGKGVTSAVANFLRFGSYKKECCRPFQLTNRPGFEANRIS